MTLTPWLHYYKTRDQGRSQLGRIDNDLYNAGLTLAGGGQSLSLSLQKVDGDTPFDFIAQNDRTFLYESNAMQYADFNGPGERSWKIQYQASLAFLAAPDWQFGAAYGRGQADLTGSTRTARATATSTTPMARTPSTGNATCRCATPSPPARPRASA